MLVSLFVKTSCYTTNSLHPKETGSQKSERENFQRKIEKHEFEGEQGNACLKLIIGGDFPLASPRSSSEY